MPATEAARISTFLDACGEAFVATDDDGIVAVWNAQAEQTFGWSRGEALGRELADLIVPEPLRAQHREGFRRFTGGGAPRLVGRRVEVPALRRDGREITVELAIGTVELAGRRHLGAFMHDITPRLEAERVQRRLAAVVASSGDAILSGSLDGTIETFNEGAERLYGYRAEEVVGRSVSILRPDASLDDVRDLQARLRSGTPVVAFETAERRKDGSLIDVSVTMSPLPDEKGTIVGVTSVVRDITKRKRAEGELRRARERFAGAFDHAAIGMAIVAPDGRFLAVNQALCALLDRDEPTLLDTDSQSITHPDDRAAEQRETAQLLAGTVPGFALEKRCLLPGGGIVWGQLAVSLVRDEQGAPLHFVAQIQDVTERKTTEQELRRYTEHLTAIAATDPLTGLASPDAFAAECDRRLEAAGSDEPALAVGIARLDLPDRDPRDRAVELDQIAPEVAGAVRVACRAGDVCAHLGGHVIAVGLDAPDEAHATLERILDAARASHPQLAVRGAVTVAERGDDAAALIARARVAVAADSPAPAVRRRPRVDRILGLAREQLGMDLAFLSRIADGELSFEAADGDATFGVVAGESMPEGDSYCARMLDGRIGPVVRDTAAEPQVRDLPGTVASGVGAYVGVPLELPDGRRYGTLCAVSHAPREDLADAHVQLMTFLASVVADLIADEERQLRARLSRSETSGIAALTAALDARDRYTGEHSRTVVRLATAVARRLGLDERTLDAVAQVAVLHDIGKVGIPDSILQKQGPLDDTEWALMRQHPVVGERVVAGTTGLSHLAPAMRAEHERWDGGGYPDGLRGTAIPIAARITLACDAFDAMTTDRPYRSALTHSQAVAELRACAGTQFDPDVVAALLEVVDCTPAAAGSAEPIA